VKRPPAALAAYSDHGSLHGTVLRAMGGAAGGLLLADLISRAFAFGLADSVVLPIAVAAGALATVASRGKKWIKGLLGGALGVGGGALFAVTAPYWSPFAALLYGASMVPILAPEESWKRKTVTGIVAGALASAGVYVGQVILSWDLFGGMVPGPLASAAAGAAAGLFVGLAGAPKHLARPADPVEVAYLEALMIKDGELHEILQRTLQIHRAVREDLKVREDDKAVAPLRPQVGDMTMRILSIVKSCRHIEADLAAAPGYELEDRIADLESKAGATDDAAAQATYRSAIETLDAQRQGIAAIQRGRERVIARLHANVALLEKVRFSLVHLRSADALRLGGESSPVTEAIAELSAGIDATSTAVGEVYGHPDDAPALLGPVAEDRLEIGPAERPKARPELVAQLVPAPVEDLEDAESVDTVPPRAADGRDA
jgi:hypothetical protein